MKILSSVSGNFNYVPTILLCHLEFNIFYFMSAMHRTCTGHVEFGETSIVEPNKPTIMANIPTAIIYYVTCITFSAHVNGYSNCNVTRYFKFIYFLCIQCETLRTYIGVHVHPSQVQVIHNAWAF